jgi:hypothetical protein
MGNFIITKLLNFKLVYKFQNMPVLQINDTFASRYLLNPSCSLKPKKAEKTG